jgi:hypothetical protein
MKFLSLAFILAIHPLYGQVLQYSGEVPYSKPASGPMPVWTGGRLIYVDSNDSLSPVVRLIKPDAIEDVPFTFTIPGANVTRVSSVAFDPDGTLALCGMSYDKTGRGGGYLAIIPPGRNSVTIKQVYPFIPELVASGGDGNIWMQGTSADPTGGVIRRYDQAGKQLGEYLGGQSFSLLDTGMNINRLSAANGRAGWYSRHAATYFEVHENGTVEKYPVPQSGDKVWPSGLVLTDGGEALVGLVSNDAKDLPLPRLYRLDRNKSTWVPVSLPNGIKSTDFAYLYGGDGNRLAALIQNRPAITFFSSMK